MAVVTTSVALTLTRTTLIKPQDLVRSWGPIPRAMLNFEANSAVLDAKPVNDQQTLTVSMVLPLEFAYRLVDASVTIDQDVANDWEVNPHFEVLNGIRGLPPGAVNRHPWILAPSHRAAFNEVALITPRAPRQPGYVIQSLRPGIAPSVLLRANNGNADVGAAGLVFAYFAFLEYDIEQAQRFPVHYPVQVYER